MKQENHVRIFEEMPVRSAVAALAVPTVISQLINIIYNLADIFFVGQIGDPNKVAAVSLALPAFMVLTAFGNLFGIGGSSAISRANGAGNPELSKKHSAFCFYTAGICALIYSLILIFFMNNILHFMGASSSTIKYAKDYMIWVMVVGGIPTVLNVVMAHMIRAEGASKQASIGLSMGGILNIILDPIFIFIVNWGVMGAAFATMLSNVASLVYFLVYWQRHKNQTTIDLNPSEYEISKSVAGPVFAAGVPAAVQTFSVSMMYMFLNKIASNYSDIHVASIGIVQKLDMVPQYVTLGISQGVIPLLGYNYAAENYSRMNDTLKFSRNCSLIFSLICVVIFEIFAPQLVWLFIHDSRTVQMSTLFLRIMCLATPFMAICNVTNSVFQATGQTKQALIIALFRKGYVGIPMLYIMDWILPGIGVVWTQPIVDMLASLLVLWIYSLFIQSLNDRYN